MHLFDNLWKTTQFCSKRVEILIVKTYCTHQSLYFHIVYIMDYEETVMGVQRKDTLNLLNI